MDDNELYHVIDRGEQARSLLEHPLIDEAFTEFDKRVFDAWKDLPARDTEGREHLSKLMHVRKKFREHFEALVTDGENAKAEIRQRKDGLLRRVI